MEFQSVEAIRGVIEQEMPARPANFSSLRPMSDLEAVRLSVSKPTYIAHTQNLFLTLVELLMDGDEEAREMVRACAEVMGVGEGASRADFQAALQKHMNPLVAEEMLRGFIGGRQ